jgi:hypothetical protein
LFTDSSSLSGHDLKHRDYFQLVLLLLLLLYEN